MPARSHSNALREFNRAARKLKSDYQIVHRLLPPELADELNDISPPPSVNVSQASQEESVTDAGRVAGRTERHTSTSPMKTVWSEGEQLVTSPVTGLQPPGGGLPTLVKKIKATTPWIPYR